MALEGARVPWSQVWVMDDCGLLTGEGGDVVIVIIWCCRVGSDVGVFIFSSVEWVCSNPVAGGPVCESSQRPMLSR